jgi:hypothetical protein
VPLEGVRLALDVAHQQGVPGDEADMSNDASHRESHWPFGGDGSGQLDYARASPSTLSFPRVPEHRVSLQTHRTHVCYRSHTCLL